MKQIDFYFDFISPYAYLAFHQLPLALQGHDYSVRYKPILFGALLGRFGHLGPAEIPPKRHWTYRQVLWEAHRAGLDLQLPAAHPFNPLPLLRLAVATSSTGMPNRYAVETIFKHAWQGGHLATDPARLDELARVLAPVQEPGADNVKNQLKHWGDEALALDLFGVPSMVVEGKVFWGADALPMLAGYFSGDPWFARPDWDDVVNVPYGLMRAAAQVVPPSNK
jgi:2-hydroxychromene-2-carboxylate isomerase